MPFSSSVTSGHNYTNDKELLRFETVCINILEYRDRQIEHAFDPAIYAGFIYIPDYYADYIIENFYPEYTYYDLISNAGSNFLSLKSEKGEFKYKIANIFHVNGFLDEHLGNKKVFYNDFETGKKSTFLDGFCFVSNYRHFYELNEFTHNPSL